MLRIETLHDHQRLSTQEVLLAIEHAVDKGETEFVIAASGQHDIGGPLWNRAGKTLTFRVTNPGQRVGAMCLPGTDVIVDGPAPADVGWLNAGGRITVRGDVGDTAGHCAAAGIIYIGGRAGTRSGSLMKHDPLYDPPELWVLKNVGSFSFEFMGGGKAVICGCGCEGLTSVLGDRPCVGMVGGTVYFRGPAGELPQDVRCLPLDADDIAFLDNGLEAFLEAVDKPRLRGELSAWENWRKIEALPFDCRERETPLSLAAYRARQWIDNGLFTDVCPDDFSVQGLVASGAQRRKKPVWRNDTAQCRDCRACLRACPEHAISRTEDKGNLCYSSEDARCIGCGLCAGVCPCAVWEMEAIPLQEA